MPQFLVTVGLGLLVCWQGFGRALVFAVDRPERSVRAAESVDVTQCRVMVIDRVTLASPRAGVLAFVEVRESDRVRTKQIVAGLDSTVAEATFASPN